MKKLIILILLVLQAFGWEVNTHQALTIKALEKNPENLKYFIETFELDNISYKDQNFSNYTTPKSQDNKKYFLIPSTTCYLMPQIGILHNPQKLSDT